jgi:hypothetical protein
MEHSRPANSSLATQSLRQAKGLEDPARSQPALPFAEVRLEGKRADRVSGFESTCLAFRLSEDLINPPDRAVSVGQRGAVDARPRRAAASAAGSPQLRPSFLDAAGVPPRLRRKTRLAELTHRLDPRLVAAAFGMTPEGALHCLIGAVETEAAAFANV